MTNDIKDWYAGITAHGGLHVLDNVHFTGSNKDFQQRLSDELCRLVTEPDPHIELRKLYTTSDIVSLPVNTVFAFTAIEQPFFTTDLIQRSAIFELEAISTGHDARWGEKQLASVGGRMGWISHHLAVTHKFLKQAVFDRKWDDNYKAGHRLANYEQALMLMADVLGLPNEWIPPALHRVTSTKMSDIDWTMSGLAEFILHWRATYPDNWHEHRFSANTIMMWAETDEVHSKNTMLTNSRKLGRYLISHKGSILKNMSMYEDGSKANKTMYSLEQEDTE
jgi:hypothetical protein